MVLAELDLRGDLRFRRVGPNLTQFEERSSSLERIGRLSNTGSALLRVLIHENNPLGHFIGFHCRLRTAKDLQSELLHVRIGCHRIGYRIIIDIFTLELNSDGICVSLWEVRAIVAGVSCARRTCSNLSTRSVVYSLTSSSEVCSPRPMI